MACHFQRTFLSINNSLLAMALVGIKYGREDSKQKSSFEQASALVTSIAVQLPVANERTEPQLRDKISHGL